MNILVKYNECIIIITKTSFYILETSNIGKRNVCDISLYLLVIIYNVEFSM